MAAQSTKHQSIKHEIISKTNATMVAAIAVAVFVVIFSLFAVKSLVEQSLYNNRVISKKQETLKQLEVSKQEADDLKQAYVAFATEPINVLGGSPTGTGPKDGDNAKLVLDSLPSVLDFPALSSSIEKILVDGGYVIQSIGGDDAGSIAGEDELGGDSAGLVGESEPQEVEFPFAVDASPQSALSLLQTLELSIRPFNLKALTIEGSGNSLNIRVNMNTYYKPATNLQVSSEVVQ